MKFLYVWLTGLMMLAAPLGAQSLESPNSFIEDVITSLAIASEARDLVVKPTSTDVEDMAATRSAIIKLGEARDELTEYSKSRDKTISDVAVTFSDAYGALAGLLGKNLDLYERLLKLSAKLADGDRHNISQQLTDMEIEGRKLNADIDQGWKLIVEMTGYSSYALVDVDRKDDGYLRITSEERLNLRRRLESFFTRPVLEKPGGRSHAVEVAPALLWKFLGRPEWKTTDPPH